MMGHTSSGYYQQADQNKERIDLSFYKNNIQPSLHPRSEIVTYKWDNQKWKTSGNCLNDLLWKKHLKFISEGPASLVGKVAVVIAQSIVRDGNTSMSFSDITFQANSKQTDIYANLGPQYNTYNAVIDAMKSNGTATYDTAYKILRNLSKANFRNNADIFEGLDTSAKKLMAFLICETIRFQDDGACARMAMRMIINAYENNSEDPFGTVFSGGQFYDAVSIFANRLGKQRMINQIMNDYLANDSSNSRAYFIDDKNKVNQIQNNFYSGDEGTTSQRDSSLSENYNTSAQTYNDYRHPMQTRNNGGYSYGTYDEREPPSSSTNTPVRAKKGAAVQKSSMLEPLTDEHDNSIPDWCPKKCFCENCNMFYYGRVPFNNEYLKRCPHCKSGNVRKINDENVEHFSYTHFVNTNFQYIQANGLPQPFEGYFIEPI